MTTLRRSGPASGGFTLLEMIAVVLLMAIVLTVAIDFYLDLSHASTAATERTRNARRAAVLLDRVAQDLEGTLLIVKPAEVDPLAHPWVFLAEAEDPGAGADRVLFVRRGPRPAGSEAAASDVEMVAWLTTEGADGDLEVRRWSWPQLPPSLVRDFPPVEESYLVAGGLASFAMRFEDEAGEWVSRWDSSTLVGSSELPIAAEIEVAFHDPERDELDGPYQRRVLLPMRPIDLEAQLAGEGQERDEGLKDEDGDGDIDEDDAEIAAERAAAEGQDTDCVTVAQCLGSHPELRAMLDEIAPQYSDTVQGSLGQCARNFASIAPVPADCMQ